MKKGDFVVFSGKYGYDDGQRHKVTSEPWKAGSKEMVLLDDKSGGWCVDGLEKWEPSNYIKNVVRAAKFIREFCYSNEGCVECPIKSCADRVPYDWELEEWAE